MHSIISHLDPHKATWYDKIPSKLLRIAAPAIRNPVTSIINNSVRTSKFSSDSKRTEIGPVHKKDELLNKKNYRTVSMLTSISKVIEKCIDQHTNECFQQASVKWYDISLRKRVQLSVILFKLCEEMRHAMDHSETAAMILMDLSKAFDFLLHDLMVATLSAYGIKDIYEYQQLLSWCTKSLICEQNWWMNNIN